MVAQQQVSQQRRPELPANGMFAFPEEAGDAQSLSDLLEEDLDAPAAFVERTHAARDQGGVVGDEDHDAFLAVEFDEHFHPPEGVGVLMTTFGGLEQDQIIPQDLPGGLLEKFLFYRIGHVVFRPRDPMDSAPIEGEDVQEIDVSLVKQGGFRLLGGWRKVAGRGCRRGEWLLRRWRRREERFAGRDEGAAWRPPCGGDVWPSPYSGR